LELTIETGKKRSQIEQGDLIQSGNIPDAGDEIPENAQIANKIIEPIRLDYRVFMNQQVPQTNHGQELRL
jgi:hypothetical protein